MPRYVYDEWADNVPDIVRRNDLAALKRQVMSQQDWLLSDDLLKVTFRCGSLAMAEWIVNNQCCSGSLSTSIFAAAALGNDMIKMRWLRQRHCPWDERVCANAARVQNLQMLQWARSNDAPWDETVCEMAAATGNLELLQWAHSNGAPLSVTAFVWAQKLGRFAVLEWLRETDAPFSDHTPAFPVCPTDKAAVKWFEDAWLRMPDGWPGNGYYRNFWSLLMDLRDAQGRLGVIQVGLACDRCKGTDIEHMCCHPTGERPAWKTDDAPSDCT